MQAQTTFYLWEEAEKVCPAGRVEAGIVTPSEDFVDYWVVPISEKFSCYHIHLQAQTLQGRAVKFYELGRLVAISAGG